MSGIYTRFLKMLNSKREQNEHKLREECLNSFDRFLDFVYVKEKDENILKYRDYLNRLDNSIK